MAYLGKGLAGGRISWLIKCAFLWTSESDQHPLQELTQMRPLWQAPAATQRRRTLKLELLRGMLATPKPPWSSKLRMSRPTTKHTRLLRLAPRGWNKSSVAIVADHLAGKTLFGSLRLEP